MSPFAPRKQRESCVTFAERKATLIVRYFRGAKGDINTMAAYRVHQIGVMPAAG